MNYTVQQIFNQGYTVLESQELTLSAGVETQIVAVAGTSKILICPNVITSQIYLGAQTVSTGNGLPLLQEYTFFDGAAPDQAFAAQIFELFTSTPDDFWLVAAGNSSVRILYLGVAPV